MAAAISLVMTTYNRERYLAAAIESVLHQTRSDFELLIWDDGSTDASVEIARAYAQQDSRIRVIESTHQGRVLALKWAVEQTAGTYLGFIDSDDLLAPTALQKTAAILDKQPAIGWVYTDYLDIDEHGKVLGYGQRCRIPYSPDRLLVDFMTHHFRLLRRSVYEQVGGLDSSLQAAEDYDLCLRLSESAKVERIRTPLYLYRNHAGNIADLEKIVWSREAIQRALKRRGLDQHFQLDVVRNHFILHRKPQAKQQANRSMVQRVAAPLAALSLAGAVLQSQPAQAQRINPARDGTGTQVRTQGNRHDITGGRVSGDGENLFHSFERFGLSEGEIANFLSRPEIVNILGRITGGEMSFINGMLQVTGSNANLYLMNPAGIVFGPHATLNLTGSFTATTATGIGFGANWFNAVGENNYTLLQGNPDAFAFTVGQPGVIVNAGDLNVSPGQNLGLLGGVVINTGELSASGGQLLAIAVPGQSMVRLSHPGNVLSLEVPIAPGSSQPNQWTLPISALPQLLTSGNAGQDLGLQVNPDGQVTLVDSGTEIPTPAGTTVISGRVNASATQPGETGGTVQLLGDRVGLVNAQVEATGTNGGGTVLVGGDFQGQGTVPNATRTYVSRDSSIDVSATQAGNGGRAIVWSDGTTSFYGDAAARGGSQAGNGGFAEVSGRQSLQFDGSVDLSAPQGELGTLLLDPENITIVNGTGATNDGEISDTDPQILFADGGTSSFTISEQRLENLPATANIVLEATGDITIADLADNTLSFQSNNAGSVTFRANTGGGGGDFLATGFNDGVPFSNTIVTQGGAVSIFGNDITVGDINSNGGNISLNSVGSDIITGGGDIEFGILNSGGGAVNLNAVAGTGFGYGIEGTAIESQGGDITVSGNYDLERDFNSDTVIDIGTIDSQSGNIAVSTTVNGVTIGRISSGANGTISVTGGTPTDFNTATITISEITAGTGDVTLTGDEIDLFSSGDGIFPGTVTGSGNLTLQPRTPGRAITIGGGEGGEIDTTLNLSDLDLAVIRNDADPENTTPPNFASITIGNPTSGAVTIIGSEGISPADVLFSDPVIIQSAQGITLDDNLITDDNASVTLRGSNFSSGFADVIQTQGDPVDIAVTGGNLNAGNIRTNGGSVRLNAARANGAGGNVGFGTITSGSGAINIDAVAAVGSGYGNIFGGSIESQGGNIAASATNRLTVAAINAGTGNIALTGNEINLQLSGTGTAPGTVTGSGTLSLQATTPGQAIAIGGNEVGNFQTDPTLNLSDLDLAAIRNNQNPAGFSTITIGNTTTSGAVAITGSTQPLFTDPVIIQSPSSITINGTLIGADNASFTLNGATILNQRVITDPDTGTTILGAGITTADQNITINGNTTLNNDTLLDTGATGGGDVLLNGTVNGGSNLTVNTGTGQTTFTNAVGNTTPLTSLTLNSTTNLNGGSVTTTGDQTYNRPVTLGADTTLAGNDITFNSTINSDATAPRALAVNTTDLPADSLTGGAADVGVTSFNGTVGGNNPLSSLTTNASGQTVIGANITARGNTIQFNDPVTLSNDVTLTDSGNITFGNTVNSDSVATPRSLSTTTSGTGQTTFTGAVGNTTPLNSLTLNSTTNLNGGSVTTAGDQTYNRPVTLGADTTLAGNDVNFNATVDSDTATTPRALTVNTPDLPTDSLAAGGGVTTFNGTVGGSNPLSSLITNASGQTVLGANITTTGNGIQLNDPVTLNRNVTLTARRNGNLDLNGTVNGTVSGNSNLTLNAGNQIAINGEVGSEVSLRALSINAADDVTLAAPITTDRNISVIGDRIRAGAESGARLNTSGGDVDLTSREGDIEVETIATQGGDITVNSDRFFRATGTLEGQGSPRNTSIDSDGGSISITHAGGERRSPVQPFVVGNAATNGTAGNITDGSDTIRANQSIPGDLTLGDIEIDTDDIPQESFEIPEDVSRSDLVDPDQVLEPDEALQSPNINVPIILGAVAAVEDNTCREFQRYFGSETFGELAGGQNPCERVRTPEEITALLGSIAAQAGRRAAIIYLIDAPDQLELVAFFPQGQPVRQVVPEANREALLAVVQEFRSEVAPLTANGGVDVAKLSTTSYLASAQQLYDWIIAPLQPELESRNIDTLAFIPGAGLRSLPLAALHDGEQFLIEQYSVGLLPSINLIDPRYQSLQNSEILAVGSGEWAERGFNLNDLPSVPIEVAAVVQQPWQGEVLLNDQFTLPRIVGELENPSFRILHLATHGEFLPGQPSDSYIQLWNTRLGLNQLRQLERNQPPVELLTLSACRTALGDESAELGFAGLALAAGAKSSLASLWYVSDIGTLSLMTEFYRQLYQVPIKAEALQQTQIAMLQGEVRLEGDQLTGPTGSLQLSEREAAELSSQLDAFEVDDLSHPFFWAAFTMVGSPW